MDLISVIVPVYKVENYLDECIASILNQTYPFLEVILIDDGSPDRSGEICDMWSAKDSRIRVIHQKNAGAGKARNVGLAVAKGNLITFVDSDDYLAPKMYESLQCLMDDGTDIVECDYLSTTQNRIFDCVKEEKEVITIYSTQEALKEHISDHYFRQLIWNKLYRKEIVADIEFPVGKKIDDEFWTYRVLGNAKKLKHLNSKLYAYRQQEISVMHLLNMNQRTQVIDAKCERCDYLLKYYPDVLPAGLQNLWESCIYQGQLVLHESVELSQKKEIIKYILSILKKYPIKHIQCGSLPVKQRLWLQLANISFINTCKLRNRLGIGL